MGMFDSLYDSRGNEWQTKAFGRCLVRYRVGDEIPAGLDLPPDFQVAILGGPGDGLNDSLATVRGSILREVDAKRDESVPLLDYWGDPR